jgi:hypothetical protein
MKSLMFPRVVFIAAMMLAVPALGGCGSKKVKGKWQVHQDTWLLRGKVPGAQDIAMAGVN